MFDRLFWWMLRRRWNLTALDLAVAHARDDNGCCMYHIEDLKRIHRDVLAAKV